MLTEEVNKMIQPKIDVQIIIDWNSIVKEAVEARDEGNAEVEISNYLSDNEEDYIKIVVE